MDFANFKKKNIKKDKFNYGMDHRSALSSASDLKHYPRANLMICIVKILAVQKGTLNRIISHIHLSPDVTVCGNKLPDTFTVYSLM